jgi:hypothetical protein
VDARTSFNAIVGNLGSPMLTVTARAGDERLDKLAHGLSGRHRASGVSERTQA